MDTTKLIELLRILREHGVTKYSTPECTLELGAATFAPDAGVALPQQPDLGDIEVALRDMQASRAIGALPPQYQMLLKAQ